MKMKKKKKLSTIKKLSNLPRRQFLKQLKLFDLLWDFDCTSLYPSAKWDKSSIYPKIETGYAYTSDMNDEVVENFINQTFTQGSGILKINNYIPKTLIV